MIWSVWPGSGAFEGKKNFSIALNEVASDTSSMLILRWELKELCSFSKSILILLAILRGIF